MVKKKIIICSESLREETADSKFEEKYSYDSEAVIRLLKNNIDELGKEIVDTEPIGFGGKEKLFEDFPGFVESKFAEFRYRKDVEIYIVVIIDADTRDGRKISGKRKQLENKVKKLLSEAEFDRIKIIFAVQAIEAWILAEEKGLNAYLNTPGKVKHENNPEAIEKPKEKLKGHFQKCDRKYTPQDLRELLPKVQISELLRCKHFKEFYEHILEIVKTTSD